MIERVTIRRFKRFTEMSFTLPGHIVLAGPNNAGKSTIIAAFRILSEAMRKAGSRKAELFQGPTGQVYGHAVDLRGAFIAEENLFFDYRDDEPAFVRFVLASQNTLTLYFPEQGTCYLIPDAQGKNCSTPSTFKAPSKIGMRSGANTIRSAATEALTLNAPISNCPTVPPAT